MDEKHAQPTDPMTIDSGLAQRIMDELGVNVYLCYQCVKCTSGCPVSEFFDWQPNQVMRALQLGQEDIALESQTPWLCASCQTCSTRCPQGLDITAIMEFLTREALERGIKPPIPEVNIFNEAFMREVRLWGRAYEPGLMVEMKLRNPQSMFDDLDLYTQSLKKMKVAFLPSLARPPRKVKPLPGAAEAVAYYPGCSLHSTAPEFNQSTNFVDTGFLPAESSMLYDLEAAWRFGPALVCGEYVINQVDDPANGDPVFTGFHLTVNYILTGEMRPYNKRSGLFRPVPVSRPVGSGGWGAVEVAGRISNLDLTDGGVAGGDMDIYSLGLNWWLSTAASFGINYRHVVLDDGVSDGRSDGLMARILLMLE